MRSGLHFKAPRLATPVERMPYSDSLISCPVASWARARCNHDHYAQYGGSVGKICFLVPHLAYWVPSLPPSLPTSPRLPHRLSPPTRPYGDGVVVCLSGRPSLCRWDNGRTSRYTVDSLVVRAQDPLIATLSLSLLSCLAQVLECPICNDQYGTEHDTTPRVLGCGHTYCSKCLTQLVTVRGAKSKVKCAFCNFQHALLRPDPTLIPANHAVIEIIKLGDVVPDDGPKCEYKGSKCTGSASWVCFDCNAGEQTLFCEKCIKTEHERQFGPVRRHRRTPMAQLNEPQTVTCHWHSKNRATLYSLKLRKFACNDCNSRADFAEQRALFEPIGPVTRQLRAQAKRLVLYSQDVLARLNAMLQSIAADKAQLSPSVQQAKTQIQEKFAAITNIVQERQQVLMDRIETEVRMLMPVKCPPFPPLPCLPLPFSLLAPSLPPSSLYPCFSLSLSLMHVCIV